MSKFKIMVVALISVLMFSMCSAVVVAYENLPLPVTFDSSGNFVGTTDLGVAYELKGTPGKTGSVSTEVRTSNPYPTAVIPEGISLARFVLVTFDIDAADFDWAKIYITYTSADVEQMEPPYEVYKYVASSNSYVKLSATVDTATRMMTITVNSVDDPWFVLGGTSVASDDGGFSATMLVALIVSIVMIVFLVVIGFFVFKKKSAGN